jgi:hypothetical protein
MNVDFAETQNSSEAISFLLQQKVLRQKGENLLLADLLGKSISPEISC